MKKILLILLLIFTIILTLCGYNKYSGDSNYSNDVLGHATIGMDRIEKVNYIYCCPNCGLEITYEEQCVVAKKQKLLKKIILNEND